jgi:hypothetical protein
LVEFLGLRIFLGDCVLLKRSLEMKRLISNHLSEEGAVQAGDDRMKGYGFVASYIDNPRSLNSSPRAALILLSGYAVLYCSAFSINSSNCSFSKGF